jgi:predicted RNA-binding Zn ribbon-like protein
MPGVRVESRGLSEPIVWAGAAIQGATAWSCLDLVNTIEWRLSDQNEFLRDYADFVRWSRHDGLVDDQEARWLMEEAAKRPAEATVAHHAAIALRESLYGLFSAVVAGASVPARSVDTLNAALVKAAVPERITVTPEGIRREWIESRHDLAWPIDPVARSAASLLTAPALERLKECPGGPNKACGFLFIDETKNRSRRWCSGRTCGNRTRVYQHYANKLAGARSSVGG